MGCYDDSNGLTMSTSFRSQALSWPRLVTCSILNIVVLNIFLLVPKSFADEISLVVGATRKNISLKDTTGKSIKVAGSSRLSGVTLQWNLTKDNLTSDSNVGYTGTVIFTNHTHSTQRVFFAINSPMRGGLIGTSKSGSTFLSLRINKDGGSISSFGTQNIVTYLVDGSKESALFSSPFLMGASGGPSSASTSSQFGFPIGSLTGSNIARSIGLKVAGKLTPGEKLSTSVAFQMTGTAN